MLNHALKYLSLGLSIIPLKPKGKEPLIPWAEFQKRRAGVEEAKEWFKKWPCANVGIVTGSVSGIAIIDLDGPEGLKEALRLGLTSSTISLTGNGKHLWYKYPEQSLNPTLLVQNSVRIYPGIDVRGDGGYIVAPPSMHENGQRYRFVNVLQVEILEVFPSNIFVTDVEKKEFKGKEITTEFKPKLDIATLLGDMKHGNRDQTLFTLCSKLRGDGFSAEDTRVILGPHAEICGGLSILDEKIKNVWRRYEPRNLCENKRIIPRTLYESPVDNGGRMVEGLIIHSPTNPDSLKHFEQLRIQSNTNEERLKTGYSKLDQMFKGGLKSSRLFTIAARTGVGKTNWLLGTTKRLCIDGKRVLLFSTEMPYAQIWERYIQTLENPEEFTKHRFYVCDSFAPNLERVEEAIKKIKPDVFMFDHINHVSEEQAELGQFMQGLNFIRRKYDCAGIVTAQLNRSADWVDLKTGEKVTPRMSMIKGSGTIEQASSRVLLLNETRVTPEYTEIVGNLDKNDNGPKGLLHFGLFTNPYIMKEI